MERKNKFISATLPIRPSSGRSFAKSAGRSFFKSPIGIPFNKSPDITLLNSPRGRSGRPGRPGTPGRPFGRVSVTLVSGRVLPTSGTGTGKAPVGRGRPSNGRA